MKSSELPLPWEEENKAGPCGSIPKKLPSSHPELTEETRGAPTKVTMSPAAEQTPVPRTFLVFKGKKKKKRGRLPIELPRQVILLLRKYLPYEFWKLAFTEIGFLNFLQI